jgi:acyl dehydratase
MSSSQADRTAGGEPQRQGGSAPRPVRADGLWLDDLAAGAAFRSDTYELTASEIVEFASRYDPQAYHLDPDQAEGTFFDGLAASGWHTAAITMRLLAASVPLATGIIGTDIAIKWPTATRPGDVLHLEIRVDSVTFSKSRPDRGNVALSYQTINQHDEVRQRTTARSIAWRRPRAA